MSCRRSVSRQADRLTRWCRGQRYSRISRQRLIGFSSVGYCHNVGETTTCRRRTCSAYTCLPLYHITYAFVVPHNTELFRHKMVADIKYIEENKKNLIITTITIILRLTVAVRSVHFRQQPLPNLTTLFHSVRSQSFNLFAR